jgi:hypothetical protein
VLLALYIPSTVPVTVIYKFSPFVGVPENYKDAGTNDSQVGIALPSS